jgi:hypothetical protein
MKWMAPKHKRLEMSDFVTVKTLEFSNYLILNSFFCGMKVAIGVVVTEQRP